MEYIDTHCHFDAAAFADDRDEVLTIAQRHQVRQIVSPATTAASWPELIQLSQRHSCVAVAFGLHPMFMAAHTTEHLDELEALLSRVRPIAVGECGLDFYIENPDRDEQKFYLHKQLTLAKKFNLPVIIHARKAVEEVLLMLREFKDLTGVMHSYSGSLEQAHRLIEQGFYLGFGGPITWQRSKRLRRLIQALPISAILLETDAPDQPGERHRGERNQPGWLPEVAEKIAEIKCIPLEVVAAVTSENAKRLFGFNESTKP